MLPENINLSKYRLEKSKMDLKAARLLYDRKLYAQSLNRAYYSIFHATRALLALDNFDSKKHSGVIAYFNKSYVATGQISKKYSKILMGAEKLRNLSDYDDFYIVAIEDVEKQLKNAAIYIEKIEQFIKNR